MSGDYHIGQVIFVVLKKEMRVYPMQIVQVITKKTLEGETVSYVVRGGTDPEAQLLLSDVDGEIFYSATVAREVLITRATASVEKLVTAAVQKAIEWYPNSTILMPETAAHQEFSSQLALLKKSPENTKQKNSKLRRQAQEVSEFKQELLEESNGESLVVLPDGSKAKVRSVKLPDSFS